MTFELELSTISGIKILGLGGAGVNILKAFQELSLNGLELIALDSSPLSLEGISLPYKVQLSRGEGRKKGSLSLLREELSPYLENAEIALIVSGLGGETSALYLPPLTRILKDLGILTIAVLLFPFHFEGKMRRNRAESIKESLGESADAILVFPNEHFYQLYPNLPLAEFFSRVNSTICDVVNGLLEPMLYPSLINLEVSTLRRILEGAGEVMIGWAEESGEKRALKAIEKGFNSMGWKKEESRKIKRLLISIAGGEDLTIQEVSKICESLTYRVYPEADIAVGTVTRENFRGIIRLTFCGIKSLGSKLSPKPLIEERKTLWEKI